MNSVWSRRKRDVCSTSRQRNKYTLQSHAKVTLRARRKWNIFVTITLLSRTNVTWTWRKNVTFGVTMAYPLLIFPPEIMNQISENFFHTKHKNDFIFFFENTTCHITTSRLCYQWRSGTVVNELGREIKAGGGRPREVEAGWWYELEIGWGYEFEEAKEGGEDRSWDGRTVTREGEAGFEIG
jgi:hypothetical protein